MSSSIFRAALATLLLLPLYAQLAPTELRVEYLKDPLGVDTPHPRFFWVPQSAERGAKQAAYQIVVTTGTETAWDS